MTQEKQGRSRKKSEKETNKEGGRANTQETRRPEGD